MSELANNAVVVWPAASTKRAEDSIFRWAYIREYDSAGKWWEEEEEERALLIKRRRGKRRRKRRRRSVVCRLRKSLAKPKRPGPLLLLPLHCILGPKVHTKKGARPPLSTDHRFVV